jgi:hypothetical protein
MNAQPSEYVGNLFALCFLIVFVFYSRKVYLSGYTLDINSLDNFTIGYIEDSPVVYVDKKDPKVDFESQQFYLDCIEALYALGMKKSEAKKKAKQIFSSVNTKPSSIQEFLMIALKQK